MSWLITGREAGTLGLLDQYGGAAAAYSLRSLSLYRTDPVVRVRRSSDDTEADFTAAQVTDGSLAAWVGAGNDGFVRTWYDQSGNGRDATQASTASQPQIVSNGSILETNSLPSVNFDGIDDRLINNSLLIAQPNTIFVAIKENQPNPSKTIIDSYNSTQSIIYYTGSYLAMGAGTVIGSITATTNTNFRLITATFNGIQSFIRVNASQVLSGNAGSNSYSGLSIGNIRGNPTPIAENYQVNVRFSEIVIYASDLSTNRAAIEANINAHYGIY
jgi:hypothetical protein